MILALSIPLGVALALASGGRLRDLDEIRVPSLVALASVLVLQSIFKSSLGERWGVVAWIGSSVILAVLLAVSRCPWLRLAAAGILMNSAALLANGHMPVAAYDEPVKVSGPFYSVVTESTNMVGLADILPSPDGSVLSLGDLVLCVAVVSLLVDVAKRWHPSQPKKEI